MTLFPKHLKAFEKQRACSAVSINIQIILDLFSTLYLSSVCVLLFSKCSSPQRLMTEETSYLQCSLGS